MKNIYMCEFNLVMGNAVYLPIATSSLAAFAKSNKEIAENYRFMPYIFIKKPISKILEDIKDPAVLALSISMWNYEFSLLLAKAVKAKYPDCVVICGGPSIPFDPSDFFQKNSYVDITCRGEGELMFSELLLELLKNEDLRDFSQIDGISYLEKGHLVINKKEHKPMDLKQYVSPYLSGEFDYLFRDDSFAYEPQIILETNRGCPFECGYCFWGRGDIPRMRYFPLELINQTIQWIGKMKIQYVFCADSNFGIIERDVKIAAQLAETKKQYGYPDKFRVCFAKNSLDRIRRIGEILAASGLSKSTTVSFQSRNPTALKNIRRQNITIHEFDQFITNCAEKKIPTYTEFIVGFPGETYESFLDGIRDVLNMNAHNEIFVYLCEILPNTYIADPAFQAKFQIQKKVIPLNEIHCNIHSISQNDVDSEYIQEYEEVISGCSTLSTTDMVRIMGEIALFQMLYSLQLAYSIIIYLSKTSDFDIISFVEFLVDQRETDILKEDNILRKNAKECVQTYEDILVNGKGRGVVAPRYGSIYWEIEEKCFLDNICAEREQLISDLECAFVCFLESKSIPFDKTALEDVVRYQAAILPRYTHHNEETVHLNYDWEKYFHGEHSLSPGGTYQVQFSDIPCGTLEEFALKVVLWGRKGGIYFNQLRKQANRSGHN